MQFAEADWLSDFYKIHKKEPVHKNQNQIILVVLYLFDLLKRNQNLKRLIHLGIRLHWSHCIVWLPNESLSFFLVNQMNTAQSVYSDSWRNDSYEPFYSSELDTCSIDLWIVKNTLYKWLLKYIYILLE